MAANFVSKQARRMARNWGFHRGAGRDGFEPCPWPSVTDPMVSVHPNPTGASCVEYAQRLGGHVVAGYFGNLPRDALVTSSGCNPPNLLSLMLHPHYGLRDAADQGGESNDAL